ncbi:hypothetical protein ACWEN3_12660 [Streptomyces sp. NPDC004561]
MAGITVAYSSVSGRKEIQLSYRQNSPIGRVPAPRERPSEVAARCVAAFEATAADFIKSEELTAHTNAPDASYRKVTTHSLADALKRFGIAPRKARRTSNAATTGKISSGSD